MKYIMNSPEMPNRISGPFVGPYSISRRLPSGRRCSILGKGKAQNAVHILSFNLVGIHAGDVRASDVGAVGALHADHFVFLVLFIDLGFALSPDPQRDIQHTLWEVQLTFCSDIFYGLNE